MHICDSFLFLWCYNVILIAKVKIWNYIKRLGDGTSRQSQSKIFQ